jgi:hypothetical protein
MVSAMRHRTPSASNLHHRVMAALRMEAKSRRKTQAALIESLVAVCASDQHLFANIIDDA